MTDLGLHPTLPDADYRADPGINASLLKDVDRSAAYALYRSTHNEDRQVFIDGRAIHCAVLEPDKFESDYIVEPTDAPNRPGSRQVNAKKPSPDTVSAILYWDEFDKEAAGRIAIPAGQHFKYQCIRDSVWEHPRARGLLHMPGHNECAVFADENGIRTKAKYDRLLLQAGFGVDLKSVQDASPEGFAKACANFGWGIQDAHYDAVAEFAFGQALEGFAFIAVEKEPPYQVGVYYLSAEDRRLCRARRNQLLKVTQGCRQSGIWPGYGDMFQEINLPGWTRKTLKDQIGEY